MKISQSTLKYLPPQEAEKYISQDEDVFQSPLKYITFLPSQDPEYPSEEGWESVVYFTGKRKLHRTDHLLDYQYVYVFSNPSMPGLYKIGYTDKLPERRLETLSRGTGVPEMFQLVYSYPCFNGIRLEREVHLALKEYRINEDREFFQAPLSTILETIERLGEKYKFK